jgi:hypothetical protein
MFDNKTIFKFLRANITAAPSKATDAPVDIAPLSTVPGVLSSPPAATGKLSVVAYPVWLRLSEISNAYRYVFDLIEPIFKRLLRHVEKLHTCYKSLSIKGITGGGPRLHAFTSFHSSQRSPSAAHSKRN